MGTIRSGLGCLSWLGAVLIVIGLLLKAFVFDMAVVGHNGMAPTLVRGERVLIYKRGKPGLGSIAVCQHPTEVGWVVGRVAASEGMSIESYGDQLRIDGEQVIFDRRGKTSFYNADNDQTAPLVWGREQIGPRPHLIFLAEDGRHLVRKTEVEAGELYLLGDYRSYMGQDSRAYGVVEASSCRGTIVFRLTPVDGLDPEIAHGYFQPIQ